MRPAEQLSTCPHLSAAEVPCKTAPFASFSGRTEKEGPARPERIPMSSSVLQAIKKGKRNAGILLLVHFGEMISLFLLYNLLTESGEFRLITLIV